MDVSHEEPELQPEETEENDLNREKTENDSEASCTFTRRESKENPLKTNRMDVSHEGTEPKPEETPEKRRRTDREENNLNREKTENNSGASSSLKRRESKEDTLKRKRMDVPDEETEPKPEETPEKRRRTETEENHEKTEKTENDSEASCSFTRRESKENPLKRKKMDVSHEEPELQPEETPEKRRRTETEENHEKLTAKFHGRYTVGNLLGEGGFGAVYAGLRKSDGKKVAIKFALKQEYEPFITLPGDTRRLPVEVALMELVCKPPRCPYVIELLEWFETPTSFILVLERPDPCVDLYKYCRRLHKSMSESLAQIIMEQVVRAACHCRDRGVLHRDIKEENILLNPHTLEVKLIDFGCGDLLKDTPYTEYAGTPIFFPPEWIVEQKYEAEPATVWGLGVLLYSLLCGEEPFYERVEIVKGKLHLPKDLSKASCSLIRWCLERDPLRRPTLKQILTHDWF
ncbi:serine/threonine-protein kinase pim-2-like [Pangasianodon hypophthalmus]|uniref:serine/threonine-protein kinase pim-2-like n=1 Tax=Pangasianodon hypophthalmus TaxID=310915 RepID=UPI0023079917|nr:serine/threonine-protein kinase pim-2-like [Pangasianodon hypophthalmus]